MTKINITNENITEMKNILNKRVFQTEIEVGLSELTITDILKMTTVHFMNINRSTNKSSSTSKFIIHLDEYEDREVVLYITDSYSTIGIRDLSINAAVSKPAPEEGYFEGEDLSVNFNIDPIDGAEMLIIDEFDYYINNLLEIIDTYLVLTETHEESEFKDSVFNAILTESTKFIAMRNIDNTYNVREIKDSYFFKGVNLYIKFEKYDNNQTTTIGLISNEVEVIKEIKGTLTSRIIRNEIRDLYKTFLDEGGKFNE